MVTVVTKLCPKSLSTVDPVGTLGSTDCKNAAVVWHGDSVFEQGINVGVRQKGKQL